MPDDNATWKRPRPAFGGLGLQQEWYREFVLVPRPSPQGISLVHEGCGQRVLVLSEGDTFDVLLGDAVEAVQRHGCSSKN